VCVDVHRTHGTASVKEQHTVTVFLVDDHDIETVSLGRRLSWRA